MTSVAKRGEILVIDNGVAAREMLSNTLHQAGYDVVCFADSAALLLRARERIPVCIFLEVRMGDRSGLDVVTQLRAQNCPAPIFVTGADCNVAMAVDAIKRGAFDFIEKPLRGPDILDRVDAAINERIRRGNSEIAELVLYLPGSEPLTPRERHVLARIIAGETNKEAALRLGLSSRTIEDHRASIMRKIGARNAAELLHRVLGSRRTT